MKKGIIKQEGCSDISDDTADVDRDLDMLEIGINKKEMGDITGDFPASSQNKHINEKKRKHDEIKIKKCKEPVKSPPEKLDRKGYYSNSSGESDSENNHEKKRNNDKEKNNKNVDTKQGRTLLDTTRNTLLDTLLEILELEMRARAIRALLKQDDLPEEGDAAEKVSNKKVDEKDATSTQRVVEQHKKKKRNYRNRSLEDYDSDMKPVSENTELVTIDLTNESDTKLSKMSQANKNQAETYFKNNEGDNKSINRKHLSEITEVSVNVSRKSTQIKSSEYKKSAENTNLEDKCKVDSNDSEKSKAESKSSWAERWLQSKDVKKVVTTSKMCANIRKRMRNARLAKQLQNSDQMKPALNLEGSVSEYQLIKAGNSANEKSEENSVTSCQQQTVSSCHKQEISSVSKEITNFSESVDSQSVDHLEINSDQAEIELELTPTENELNIYSVGADVNITDFIKNKE